MLRLLFWALLFYLAYRVLRAALAGKRRAPSRPIQGGQSKPPLDLSRQDVEDAKFEEVRKK
ncbi:MAG: hypothetical protein ONB48_08495 [candidate division KSB1 bacterium]|nr:hypothetical protein [candidate division KSB1 bacterium]MDZ7276034.1 hypothetical protein [candidate division KSB1 bacterium]MDZ7285684.1 hypothetical protein [candidate division KSB1 bacterium]MDZ7298716.1 hypothetical protein [candidate division KSB1 bacterium]MDZ7307535.1 hypothetical protein [candidate division KSB1 bacterium]